MTEAQDWSIPTPPPVPMRKLEPPCRCGWPDLAPWGTPPVRVPIRDLRDAPGQFALTRTQSRANCAACTHPILAGRASVVHRLTNPGAVFNRYHPECVDAGKELT